MANQTETRTRQRQKKKAYAEFDEYIRFQLQKTRQGIRSTDIFTAACGIAVAVVTYLLLFVVLDHWVIPGGFGYLWRVGLLSLLLVGSLAWIGWKVVMPWLKSINQLYAARAIENASPEFNSTLLNYVDLKAANREVAPEIMTSLEKQAAVTLSHVEVDEAVDRQPLLRLCYALLFVVVAFCLYTVFSPKRVGPSIWRALMPASSVQVATQTQFLSIKPGDTEAFAREIVEVTVDLTGEIPKEITLYFSTDDHSFVKEPVPMRQTDEGLKQYRCVLKGENGEGLLQGVDYWIEAGDAKSDVFHVTVNQPPSVSVDSVHYDFPAYTSLNSQTSNGGAIETLEGTKVRIEAKANMPVKLAKIQFSDSELFEGKSEEAMVKIGSDSKTVSFEFQPQLRNKKFPKFYRIWCRTKSGATDPSPAVHPIAITADQLPELTLVSPTKDRTVAANAIVPMLVRSNDPDYRLSQVKLILKRGIESLPFQMIYEGNDRATEKMFELKVEDLKVQPGDVITYLIEAQDNRFVDFSQSGIQLGANRVRTLGQKLTIEEPVTPEQAEQQAEAEKKEIKERLEETGDANNQDDAGAGNPEEPDEANPDEPAPRKGGNEKPPEEGNDPDAKPKAEKQPGEKSEGGEKTKGGEDSDNGKKNEKTGSKSEAQQDQKLSNDGRDDAEALRQILKDEQEKQERQEAKPKDGEENKPSDTKPGDTKPGDTKPGDTKPGDTKPGDTKPGDSKPGDTKPGDTKPGDTKPGDSKPGDTKPGDTKPGDTKPGDTKPGDSKPGDSKPGDSKPGDSKPGDSKPGDSKPGDSKPGDSKPGDSKPGDSKPGGSKPGGSKPGDSKPGDSKPGDSKPGDSKPGDSKPGDSKPGDSKPGDSKPGDSKPGDSKPGDSKPGDSKPGDSKPGDSKPGDSKPGDSKPGDSKPGDSKPGDSKPGDSKPGDSKPGDSKPGDSKPGDSKPGDSKPGDSKPGDSKPGDSKPGDSKPGDSKPGDSKPGDSKPGDSKPGDSKPGDSKPGDSKPGDSKPGDSKPGDSKPGDSKPGDSKPGDSKPGDSKPGKGESGKLGEGKAGEGEAGSKGSEKSGKGKPKTHSGPASKAAGPNSGKPTFDPEKIGEQPGEEAQQAQHAGGQVVDSTDPEAEAANLEDRKKAANLVLKKLQDELERGDVNDELLKKLGWTEDDMKKFVERMSKQQKTAETEDPASLSRQRQYEEMLKSLNLNHDGGKRSDSVKRKQDTTDFLDRGSNVPVEYRKAFEEYTKRMSRKKSQSR